MSAAKSWREYPQRYRMEASKNKESGKTYFPPRLICPVSKSTEFETVQLASEGKIETFTVINTPTAEFIDEAPLVIAIVELDDGVKINSQIADVSPEDVKIGDRVRISFRKIFDESKSGIINYGYKCVPIYK